ncbi:type I-B CRISPR-associated endonuclease Cas1b [Caminibacter pacificus]
MKTRYIFSMGQIQRKDNSIAFKNEKGWHYVPVEGVREIYFMNEVSLNTKFLDFAARAGIVLHFFNYHGGYSGTFYPKEHYISGRLKIAQVNAYNRYRLDIAKSIILAVAENLRFLLYHYYRHGKQELKAILDWLNYDIKNIVEKTTTIKQLLYVEGQMWIRFYDTFNSLLPLNFQMQARVKRPPNNPINALISFGNTLLYTKTISAIYQTHLDQSISFLHEPMESRFSLSLDLSEAFKPVVVFRTIFELINRRKIRVDDHFEKRLNYAILNREGKKIFIQAFESRLSSKFVHSKLKRNVSLEHAIKLDGYKLIKYLLNQDMFNPFSIKEKQ